MGTLFVGTAILGMAAFSPFLLLKLIPMAEAALVAQGVSRAPVRGAQSTLSNVHHAQSISRLTGGVTRGSTSGAATATQSAPWSVRAGTTAHPAATGGSRVAGGAAAAGAGPAGTAVAAGTAVLSTGTRAVGQPTQSAAEVVGGRGESNRPQTEPPSAPTKDRPR